MGGARLIELPTETGQEVGEADGVEGEAAEGVEDGVGGGAGGEDVGGGEEGVAPVGDEAVGEGYGGDARGGAGVVVGVVRAADGGGEFHEGVEELSLQLVGVGVDALGVDGSGVVATRDVGDGVEIVVFQSGIEKALDRVGETLAPGRMGVVLEGALLLVEEGGDAVPFLVGVFEGISDDDGVDAVVAGEGADAVGEAVDFGGGQRGLKEVGQAGSAVGADHCSGEGLFARLLGIFQIVEIGRGGSAAGFENGRVEADRFRDGKCGRWSVRDGSFQFVAQSGPAGRREFRGEFGGCLAVGFYAGRRSHNSG